MDEFWWGILLAARIMPMVVLVPVFGGKMLPIVVKICLVIMVTSVVYQHAHIDDVAPAGLFFIGLLGKELAVGTVLALSASCMFEGLRIGGQLIDDLRGSSQTTALVPQSDERTSPMGHLHLQLAVLVFFSVGGPAIFLNSLLASFEQLPVAAYPSGEELSSAGDLVLTLSGEAIRMGVSIAFPAALAILVTDCILGFMNRTAPQIQVFFLGMPARAVIGIVVVMLTLDGSLERFVATLVG
jgi:flagellar biosynthesis protein FliR